MFHLNAGLVALFGIGLVAASINGALGYGFSSITVPLALLFFSNKLLSPALVIVELGINTWIVYLNRQGLAAVRKHATPILLGLGPGILVGAYLLTSVNSSWLKLATYVVLLPLILTQAAGFRRPIRSTTAPGVALGLGTGVLYATTTISGPPLALMFNNQGLDKEEFRGALGIIRVAETMLTAIVYGAMGLYSSDSARMAGAIAPAVLIGLPLGACIIRRVQVETFRRLCMSFDAWVVGFGLARTIIDLKLLKAHSAYGVWLMVILFDLYLLYIYFERRAAQRRVAETEAA